MPTFVGDEGRKGREEGGGPPLPSEKREKKKILLRLDSNQDVGTGEEVREKGRRSDGGKKRSVCGKMKDACEMLRKKRGDCSSCAELGYLFVKPASKKSGNGRRVANMTS